MSNKEQAIIFSRNLLKYLSINNKSQKEVADSIGVSPQTFNTWCQGIAIPRMGKVQLLADYFNINKSDLIDNNTADSPAPQLRPDEQELLDKYEQLNDTGKKKLTERADELLEVPSYTVIAASKKREA